LQRCEEQAFAWQVRLAVAAVGEWVLLLLVQGACGWLLLLVLGACG
jgi:hypothetical protein